MKNKIQEFLSQPRPNFCGLEFQIPSSQSLQSFVEEEHLTRLEGSHQPWTTHSQGVTSSLEATDLLDSSTEWKFWYGAEG